MAAKVLCITNNPRVRQSFASLDIVFIEGSSLDVFNRARDLIHIGWRFLGHPHYGNFSPAKAPYRTLVLESPPEESKPGAVDMESFAMLEKVFENFRVEGISAVPMPEEMLTDFATVDYALMKETVTRYIPAKNNVKTERKTKVSKKGEKG